MNAGISFDDVTVAYRGAIALDSFSLTIAQGEIVALIGPSGSGKTTALRAVAGFVKPARGRVRIGDVDVTDVPPYARGVGLVVQNYALFPHMNVRNNVAFGLRARSAVRDVIERRVRECLDLVGMVTFAGRLPRELSGGQQQRVAIARALAIEPRVLLLDEPLSALDAQIRRSMLNELVKLHRDLPSLTVLYVTHDQSEALTLANRIAVLRDGRLSSFGASQLLYRRPPNRFTAEFLGSANLLPVRVGPNALGGGFAQVQFGESRLSVVADRDCPPGARCFVCVRPHDIRLTTATPNDNRLTGTVEAVQWQGDHHAITLRSQDAPIRVTSLPLREPPTPGSVLEICFAPADAMLIAESAT